MCRSGRGTLAERFKQKYPFSRGVEWAVIREESLHFRRVASNFSGFMSCSHAVRAVTESYWIEPQSRRRVRMYSFGTGLSPVADIDFHRSQAKLEISACGPAVSEMSIGGGIITDDACSRQPALANDRALKCLCSVCTGYFLFQ